MRHEAGRAPVAELLLASRVIALTLAACLVSRARGTQRVTPRQLGAGGLAVPIATVAARAQEEHLAAPTTRDEAKRLHRSGCDRQKFGGSPESCDDYLV
jgi:hypothetical protein